jgi:hypothetical protein
MKEKWSSFLSKEKLSEFLVDDAINEAQGRISPDTINILRMNIEEKKQTTVLKKAIKSLKKIVQKETCEALIEEPDEISNDFSWKKTKRGQYVSNIQDWAQSFHYEFREMKEFEDVYIGGHSEREVVFVTGKLKSKEVFNKLLGFIESKEPPYKLLTKILISEQ